jgi:hypothetical protein
MFGCCFPAIGGFVLMFVSPTPWMLFMAFGIVGLSVGMGFPVSGTLEICLAIVSFLLKF